MPLPGKQLFSIFFSAALLLTASPALGAIEQTEMVEVRDGTRLATDIYMPENGTGPWPTILVRTPYDKSALAELGRNFADNAPTTVVVQDMRGRFASEGTDCVFRCDSTDGADTIAWIAAQSWSNGKIVSQGGSALGIAQYMHAVEAPDSLQAMWVEVGTPTLYDHGISQGGAFRQSMMERWLQGQGSEFFLDDIRAHPLRDEFWNPVQTDASYGEVDVPAVHWGGWYDIFAQGTIDAFRGYQHEGGPGARGNQQLVMGPWIHGGWGENAPQGELQYPANAFNGGPLSEDSNMLLTWLAHYTDIAPDQAAIDAMPTVQYYVMGDVDDPNAPGNVWRSADDWPPPAAPVRLYLQPGGGLAEVCPPEGGGSTGYSYDPTNPSPTEGGANLAIPAGPFDQREVESRSDVVVFDTGQLAESREVTGRVRAHLYVKTNTPDTDIVVRLTDVYPDGRSMLVLDAPQRLATRNDPAQLETVTPGEVVKVTVDLWSTSMIFAPGHQLRISVASSNSPRFWANPNDGTSYGDESQPQVADVEVFHSSDYPSYLEVPSPAREGEQVVTCESDGEDAGMTDTGTPDTGANAEDSGAADATSDDGSITPEQNGCSCSATPQRPPLSIIFFGVGILLIRRRNHE